MEFKAYFKEKEKWISRIIQPPSGSNQDFFRALKMKIIKEIEEAREDINELSNYNCRVPHAKKEEDQKWLNNLVKIRKANTLVYEQLKLILIHDDCIVCAYCGGLMTKVPLDVPLNKLGGTFVLSLNVNNANIEYMYQCPNCVYAIGESVYNKMVNRRKEKEMLIKKGIYFVPNDFGEYNWLSDKPSDGQKYLEKEPVEVCEHVIDRKYFYGKNDTGKAFLKSMQDTCIKCEKATFTHIFK